MKLHRWSVKLAAGITVLIAGLGMALADGIVDFEAESGALGSDWAVTNGSPTFITILTDGAGYNPGSAARVATYTVTFPAAGTYQLYARIEVGPGGYNDDSLFYPTSFGTKSPTLNSDWVFVNGLAAVGYTASGDIVNGAGTAGYPVWKWINLSQFAGNINFVVSAGSLTQTFQIGARENGLDIDKFAFGTVGTALAVSNLDSGTLPIAIVLTNSFTGPDGLALHRFNPLTGNLNLDGANPAAGLAWSGGNLVGTTLNGGTQGAGTVFYLSPDGTNFSAFRSFTNTPDAGSPQGELAPFGDGFFGTTRGGGSSGVGTVFIGSTNGISTLHSFATVSADEATNSGGASPCAFLAVSGSTLCGTTTAGGAAANGTIFSLATNGSAFAVVHDFTALDCNTGTNSDGAQPVGGVVLSGNTLYGTASAGGPDGAGVVFSASTGGSGFTVLHPFSALDSVTATNRDGAFPSSGLVLSNGVLYGTALAGGAGGKGVVFALNIDGTGFTVLHSFSATDPSTGTNLDGASPCAPLAYSAGVLYGTAAAGGAGADGTIFALSTNGAGFQTLHAFTAVDSTTGTNRDGARPVAGLLPLGNSLYGTAFTGGPGAMGTVFSVPIPPPAALITNITRSADGSVALFFSGVPNSTNVIQAAAALTPPAAWQNVSTNVAGPGGAWQFTEPNTTNPARFYRSYAPQN